MVLAAVLAQSVSAKEGEYYFSNARGLSNSANYKNWERSQIYFDFTNTDVLSRQVTQVQVISSTTLSVDSNAPGASVKIRSSKAGKAVSYDGDYTDNWSNSSWSSNVAYDELWYCYISGFSMPSSSFTITLKVYVSDGWIETLTYKFSPQQQISFTDSDPISSTTKSAIQAAKTSETISTIQFDIPVEFSFELKSGRYYYFVVQMPIQNFHFSSTVSSSNDNRRPFAAKPSVINDFLYDGRSRSVNSVSITESFPASDIYQLSIKLKIDSTRNLESGKKVSIKLDNYVVQTSTRAIGAKDYYYAIYTNDPGPCSAAGGCYYSEYTYTNFDWYVPGSPEAATTLSLSYELNEHLADEQVALRLKFEAPFKLVSDSYFRITLDAGTMADTSKFQFVDTANNSNGKNFSKLTTTVQEMFAQTSADISADTEKNFIAIGYINPSASVIINYSISVFDQKLDDNFSDQSTGKMIEEVTGTLNFDPQIETAYTLVQESTITGRPSMFQFSFTTFDKLTASIDNLMFKVVMPASNFWLGDVSAARTYMDTGLTPYCKVKQDGDYLTDASNADSENFSVTIDAPITAEMTVYVSCIIGQNIKDASSGSDFIVEIYEFKNTDAGRTITQDLANNLYRAGLLLSTDDYRCKSGICETSGFTEDCFIYCSHYDDPGLAISTTADSFATFTAKVHLLSGQNSYAYTAPAVQSFDEGDVIYEITFMTMNVHQGANCYLMIKSSSLSIVQISDIKIICASDNCNSDTDLVITEAAQYANKQFRVDNFFKDTYVEAGTVFRFYIRGMKRLTQTAFGTDVTFTISSYWENSVTDDQGVTTKTDYVIDKHKGTATSFAQLQDIELFLEGVEKNGQGYDADEYTLKMRIPLEDYVPPSSTLKIEIPKRNINLQAYDDPTYQKDNESLTALGQQRSDSSAWTSLTATYNGDDITAQISSTLFKIGANWEPDVLEIVFSNSQAFDQLLLDPDTALYDKYTRILELTLPSFNPPTSTQPVLGFTAQFSFDFDGAAVDVNSKFTTTTGLKIDYAKNTMENGDVKVWPGTINIGQGDVGILSAVYDLSVTPAQAVPKFGWIDINIPVGIGYQLSSGSADVTTLNVQCSDGCADTSDTTVGWDSTKTGAIFSKNKLFTSATQVEVKVRDSERNYQLRIENAFSYILPNDGADLDFNAVITNGLVMSHVGINFQMENWVNTLSNPSQNYYDLVTGYTIDGKDYKVDAFKVLIEMLEPDSATLSFRTVPSPSVTGEIVDLEISYQLTQTLLQFGLIQIKPPKDLTQYQNDGITPRSAIIDKNSDTPVSTNIEKGSDAASDALTVTTTLEYLSLTDSNNDGIIDTESIIGTFTFDDYEYYKWFVKFGEAFDNDELMIRLGNDGDSDGMNGNKAGAISAHGTLKDGTPYDGARLKVYISKFRMPPSMKHLHTWEASIRQPSPPTVTFTPLSNDPAATLSNSSEKVTNFVEDTGLIADQPLVTDTTYADFNNCVDKDYCAKLTVGQNANDYYAFAEYEFTVTLQSPIPKKSLIQITCTSANCEKTDPGTGATIGIFPDDVNSIVLNCDQPSLKCGGPSDFSLLQAQNDPHKNIIIKHIGSSNMYRGDVLTFRLQNLNTLDFGEYSFEISTFQYVTSQLADGDINETNVPQIDSYTGLRLELIDITGSYQFTVRSAADYTGGTDSIEFTWTLNNQLSLDDYWIYVALPKANIMYKPQLDALVTCADGLTQLECAAEDYPDTVYLGQASPSVLLKGDLMPKSLTTADLSMQLFIGSSSTAYSKSETVEDASAAEDDKWDADKFRFQFIQADSVILKDTLITLKIFSVKNPHVIFNLDQIVDGVDIKAQWDLKVEKLIDSKYLQVFKSGGVTKDSSDNAPANVRLATVVPGVFKSTSALGETAIDEVGMPFEFEWFPENPYYSNTYIKIVAPTSTIWDQFDTITANDIVLECMKGCKKDKFTKSELTGSDGVFKQEQTLWIYNLFSYTPGSNEFFEDFNNLGTERKDADRPSSTLNFKMGGWKKPDSDACEDFVFETKSLIETTDSNGATATESSLVEKYTGIVLSITDVAGSASLPCTLSVISMFGSNFAHDSTLTTAHTIDMRNSDEIEGLTYDPSYGLLFKPNGNCRNNFRYKTFVKDADGRLLKSSYVQLQAPTEYHLDYDSNGNQIPSTDPYTLTLDPSQLTDEERVQNHAIYIQAFDLSRESATNWICFTLTCDTSKADNSCDMNEQLCESFCQIARIDQTATNTVEILTDENSCVDSVNTGNQFSFYSNDDQACPLVQTLRDADGIKENFYEGSFRVRPNDSTLKSLSSVYYKQSIFTGCANGISQQYNLFFYRRKCTNFSVIQTSDTLELEFYYLVDGESVTALEEFQSESLGFSNPDTAKCLMKYKFLTSESTLFQTCTSADVCTEVSDFAATFAESGLDTSYTVSSTSGSSQDLFIASLNFEQQKLTLELAGGVTATDISTVLGDNSLKFTMAIYVYFTDIDSNGNAVQVEMNHRQITVNFKKCETTKCESCSFRQFKAATNDHPEYLTFWDYSIGCSKCQDPYTYLDNDGNEDTTLRATDPDDTVKSNQISEIIESSGSYLIDRQCITDKALIDSNLKATDGDSLNWGYLLGEDLADPYSLSTTAIRVMGIECQDIIANCTLCATSLTCLECNDPSKLLPSRFKTKSQEAYVYCTNQINYGLQHAAHTSSQQCGVENNCLYCQSASAQDCTRCPNGYFQDGTRCTQIDATSTTSSKITFYVKGVQDGDVLTQHDAHPGGDITLSNPLTHIQEVFTQLNVNYNFNKNYDDEYSLYEVDVYLGKGTHYFYTCSSRSCSVFCDDSLQPVYLRHDNVVLNFKPVTSAHLPLADVAADQQDAYNNDFLMADNEKATIAVMDSQAYFNITRAATFTDIIFRGDYGLLSDRTDDAQKTMIKQCEIDETVESDFYKHEILKFTEATKAKCVQPSFHVAAVDVDDDREDCVFTQTIGSVRSCKGEPYSNDYDTLYPGSGVKYLRHSVLFNLYNYDLEQSRYNPATQATPLVSLTLTNCEFKYFVDDYEALIYMETSIVERVDTLFSEPYIVQLGDDRGARVTITNSVFKHSNFCKGLIVYREMPELLPYDTKYLVFNFAYETGYGVRDWTKRTETVDGFGADGLPKIEIANSKFQNLNHGQVLTHLSMVEESYQSTLIASMPTTNGKLVPYFDNHGAVLNVEGFPGEIIFSDNEITNNMYFVSEVFPSYRSEADINLVLDTFTAENQVQMIQCIDGLKNRFFGDYLTSAKEQDSAMLSKLEKHSAIYIGRPEWPIRFENNVFEGNVGVFGGAVSINSPVFKNMTQALYDSSSLSEAQKTLNTQNFNDLNNQPVIVFKGNTFSHNQAYLSGNAIYIRYTRQHYPSTYQGDPDVDGDGLNDWFNQREQQFLCGGGLLIESNTFSDNSAIIHASHGGAISIECDFVDPQDVVKRFTRIPRVKTSEFDLLSVNKSIFDSSRKARDLFKDDINLDPRFIVIKDNTFLRNEVGQKGTAIYTRQITNLLIETNTFTRNQPGYSFRNIAEELPYYKYLSLGVRPTLFAKPTSIQSINNEFDYLDYNRYDSTTDFIDLPQVQGAIYVESCASCLVRYSQPSDGCGFCYRLHYTTITIQGNNFEDNQDGFSIYKQHTLTRASQIYIRTTADVTINSNTISKQRNIYDIFAPESLPDFQKYLPVDYFSLLQSPLVRVYFIEGSEYALNDDGSVNTQLRYEPATLTIDDNELIANHLVQPWIAESQFKGALFEIETVTDSLKIVFNLNRFDDNYVRGGDAGLIYVQGGKFSAHSNRFYRSGQLDTHFYYKSQAYTHEQVGSSCSIDASLQLSDFCYHEWTQSRGIFWFAGIDQNSLDNIDNYADPVPVEFKNNTVMYAFAKQGVVYSHDVKLGTHPRQVRFEENHYEHLFALDAAVMKAQMVQDSAQTYVPYAVHNYTNEIVHEVQNGAFVYLGNVNEFIVSFRDIKVTDSYSVALKDKHGVAKRGLFTILDSYFVQMLRIDVTYSTNEGMIVKEYDGFKEFFKSFPQYSRLRRNRLGYLRTDDDTFRQQANDVGVIRLSNVLLDSTDIDVEKIKVLDDSATNKSVSDRVLAETGYIMTETLSNLIQDSKFTNIQSRETSGIKVETSRLVVEDSTFKNNTAYGKDNSVNAGTALQQDGNVGTTFLVQNAEVNITRTSFTGNRARLGGGMYISEKSLVNIVDSTFKKTNVTSQAGALMIESDSLVNIQNVAFEKHLSSDAASVMTVNEASVFITEGRFYDNVANVGTIQLSSGQANITDSFFVDNFGYLVTNGFVLTESQLNLTNTQITNRGSPNYNYTEVAASSLRMLSSDMSLSIGEEWRHGRRFLQTESVASYGELVQAGFFYASSTSTIDLTETSVQKMKGKIGSAMMISMSSTVNLDASTFSGLEIIGIADVTSAVISSQNSRINTKNKTIFSKNEASEIYSAGSNIKIESGSIFYGKDDTQKNPKKAPFIYAQTSTLEMSNSTMRDSDGDTPRGIHCFQCYKISIDDSSFIGLNSNQTNGAAMLVEKSGCVTVTKSSFVDVKAAKGPVMYVTDSHVEVDQKTQIRGANQTDKFLNREFWVDNDLAQVVEPKVNEELSGFLQLFWLECTNKNAQPPAAPSRSVDNSQCTFDSTSSNLCWIDQFFSPIDEQSQDRPLDGVDENLPKPTMMTNIAIADMGDEPVPEKPPDEVFPQIIDFDFSLIAGSNGDLDPSQAEIGYDITEGDLRANKQMLSNFSSAPERLNYRLSTFSGNVLNMNITLRLDESVPNWEYYLKQLNSTYAQATIQYAGETPEGSNKGGFIAYADDGVFIFENKLFKQEPDKNNTFEIFFNFVNNRFTNDTEFFNSNVNKTLVLVHSKQCEPSTYYTGPPQYICIPCNKPETTYKKMASFCEPCAKNADCSKGTVAVPNKGFIKPHETSALIVRCYNREACSGDGENQLQNCAPGYGGYMCASCEPGYWKNPDTFNCYECNETATENKLGMIVGFFFVIFVLFQLFNNGIERTNAEFVAIIRITINTLQYLFLLSKLQAQETPTGAAMQLQTYSDYISYFSQPALWVIDFQCNMGAVDMSDAGSSAFDRYWTNLLLNVMAIPVLIVISAIPMIAWNLLRTRCCKDLTVQVRKRIILQVWTLGSIIAFLLYPNLIFTILSPFNCVTAIDSKPPVDTGEEDQPLDQLTTRLVAHPETICFTSEWFSLMYIAAPALIIYMIAIPILALRHISARKEFIFNSGRDDRELTLEQQQQARDVKVQYGFLFTGLAISRQFASDNTPKPSQTIQNLTDFNPEQTVEQEPTAFRRFLRRVKTFLNDSIWVPLSGNGVPVKLAENSVGRSFFYWEFFLMGQKAILCVFMMFIQRYQVQGILVFFLILGFILIQLNNEPYYTKRLQSLHIIGLLLCLIYTLLKLVTAGLSIYSGQISSSTTDAVTDNELLLLSRAFDYVEHNASQILLISDVYLGILGVTALYFLRAYYIHFLMTLIEYGFFNGFRIFTCFCCAKLRPFMRANMNSQVYFTRWKVTPDDDPIRNLPEDEMAAFSDTDKLKVSHQLDQSKPGDSNNPLEDMMKPAERDNQAVLDAMTAKAKAAKQKAAASAGGRPEGYDFNKRKDSVVSSSGIFLKDKNEAEELGDQVSEAEKQRILRTIEKQKKKRKNGNLIAEETDSVISSDENDKFDSGSDIVKPDFGGKSGRSRKNKRGTGSSAASSPRKKDGAQSDRQKSARKEKDSKSKAALNKFSKAPVNLFKGSFTAVRNAESARKRNTKRQRFQLPDDYDLDSPDEGAPSALDKSEIDAKSKFNNAVKQVFKKAGDKNKPAAAAAGKDKTAPKLNTFNNIFKKPATAPGASPEKTDANGPSFNNIFKK